MRRVIDSRDEIIRDAFFRLWNLKELKTVLEDFKEIKNMVVGFASLIGIGGIGYVSYFTKWPLGAKLVIVILVVLLIVAITLVRNVLRVAQEKCSKCSLKIEDDIFTLARAAHDVVHAIRDSIEEEGKFLNAKLDELKRIFENELQHVLDRCQEYFSERYDTPQIVVSLMEVNDPQTPDFMMTKYYSSNASIDRKKYRSYISEQKGEVAGKFLQIAALRDGGKGHEEMTPVIWDSSMLERRKYIEYEHQNTNLNHEKIKKDKQDKCYDMGISSPFFVNQKFMGCINVDCLRKNLKTNNFKEEDAEVLRFFGDACALIYEIMELVESTKSKERELQELREIINDNVLDKRKLMEDLNKI